MTMRPTIPRALACSLCLLMLVNGRVHAQTVQVVNMIPAAQSNETTRDAEPNIAVNPVNRFQIAGTAFTPDPMASGNSPIFVSIDGGLTWNLNVSLPAAGCGSNATCDATVRFGGSSSILYAGILRGDNQHLNILRTSNFLAGGLMTILVDRGNDDQPWVQAATVLELAGTGDDRVYIGNNDFSAPASKTATVDASLSAATAPAPAGFNSDRIEVRATTGQDGPPIRTAVHLDGTVYAVFYGQRAGGNEVVVVRDNNWATGGTPFTSLLETGTAGQRVATGLSVNFGMLGNQRTGSNLAIAVDPNDSRIVYVAWADGPAASQTLHVRNSIDRGQTWSPDLRAVSPATNPGLAINSHGKVGFLYQKLVGGNRWQTHLETTTNAFTGISDLVLADLPDQKGSYGGSNTIGDYVNVIATDKDFYGVFSGFNTPDNANFPNGVTYQRFADFTTHQLFADMAHTIVVGRSIDVFFFHVTEMPADQDFYVRDWTASTLVNDQGQEPSFNTVFWNTSDVWNRASNSPGAPNGNDQFSTDAMQAGLGANGDNFAFVRIHRNGSGSAAAVTAHFLISPFGVSSNFQDAGVGIDPTINFGVGDTSLVLASGYQWNQGPTASTHACMAVQIIGPSDPFIPPGLVGTAPGWPSGIAMVEDNNKAQRNLDVNHVMSDRGGIDYALIHNAATFTRDLQLAYEAPRNVFGRLKDARIAVVGGPEKPFRSGDTITLEGMRPGENRWVALNVTATKGDAVPVNFFEIVNGRAINGFTILTQPVALDFAVRENLKGHVQAFNRLAASFKASQATDEAEAARALLSKRQLSRLSYLEFLKLHQKRISALLDQLLADQHSEDPFGLRKTLESLGAGLRVDDAELSASAHGVLLNKLDAFTTMLQKEQGDPADLLQMVRWQKELYSTLPQLRRLKESALVVSRSQAFIEAFARRKAGYDDYPRLIRGLLEGFHQTGKSLAKTVNLEPEIGAIENQLGSVAGLEKAHRNYLLRLESQGKTR